MTAAAKIAVFRPIFLHFEQLNEQFLLLKWRLEVLSLTVPV